MKARVTVLGNVGNYSPWGINSTLSPSHGNNCATAWTGVKASGTGSVNSGTSIDQAIAQQLTAALGKVTPLDSLQVGLSTLDSYTDGLPGMHSRSISWK